MAFNLLSPGLSFQLLRKTSLGTRSDDIGGDKDNSDAVVMSPGKGSPSSSDKGTLQPRTATSVPPPATQVLGGSYGMAEDDSDDEESGDGQPGKGSPSSSDKGTLQPRTTAPVPPPATQVLGASFGMAEDDSDEEESGDELHLGGSFGMAEDDSDEEESGDELHRNKRNCGDNRL